MNRASSPRTRWSAALTVIGAVLLMCGVIMALVGEVMRLKQGELHGLVSGGVVVAALGLGFGAAALVAAVRPPRRQGRFWAPGHPGYAVPRPPVRTGYPRPRSEPPEPPRPPDYAYSGVPHPRSSAPAAPAEVSPGYPGAGQGGAAAGSGPARGPFDAYDQFASAQAVPADPAPGW